MIILKSAKSLSLPGGNYTFFSLLLLLFTIFPFLFFSYNDDVLYDVVNILQIFFFLLSVEVAIKKNIIITVLRNGVVIFTLFVIASIVLMIYIPSYQSPLNPGLVLIQTGFGGSRTGWSPTISLFLPLILYGIIKNRLISLLIILSYIFSQFIVGGRAGLFTSFIIIFLFILYNKNIRATIYKLMIVFITFFVTISLFWSNIESSRIYLTLFSDGSVDDISTGRVSVFYDAITSIISSPLIGYGKDIMISGHNVHNIFLKGWLEYGFLHFIIMIFIVAYPLVVIKKNISYSTGILFSLISGIIIGLIEPAIIFGNFSTYSFWWLCYGLAVSASYNKRTTS